MWEFGYDQMRTIVPLHYVRALRQGRVFKQDIRVLVRQQPAARSGEFEEQLQRLRYRVTDSTFECGDPVRGSQIAEPIRQVLKALA